MFDRQDVGLQCHIVDWLLKAHTTNEKLETEKEAAYLNLQILRRKNTALETELVETKRELVKRKLSLVDRP
jgi:hypothetical protein